jgi:hypothetical protein
MGMAAITGTMIVRELASDTERRAERRKIFTEMLFSDRAMEYVSARAAARAGFMPVAGDLQLEAGNHD